jgi:hypothetical protein
MLMNKIIRKIMERMVDAVEKRKKKEEAVEETDEEGRQRLGIRKMEESQQY